MWPDSRHSMFSIQWMECGCGTSAYILKLYPHTHRHTCIMCMITTWTSSIWCAIQFFVPNKFQVLVCCNSILFYFNLILILDNFVEAIFWISIIFFSSSSWRLWYSWNCRIANRSENCRRLWKMMTSHDCHIAHISLSFGFSFEHVAHSSRCVILFNCHSVATAPLVGWFSLFGIFKMFNLKMIQLAWLKYVEDISHFNAISVWGKRGVMFVVTHTNQ